MAAYLLPLPNWGLPSHGSGHGCYLLQDLILQSSLNRWAGDDRGLLQASLWNVRYCIPVEFSWVVKRGIFPLVFCLCFHLILIFTSVSRSALCVRKSQLFLLSPLFNSLFLAFQIWIEDSILAKRISEPVHWGQTNSKFFLSAGTFSSAIAQFGGFGMILLDLARSGFVYADNVTAETE